MDKKTIVKMIVDFLMLILMLLEYSKLYTGQLVHEIIGIILFVLFITHNILNINFYRNIFNEKYNAQRIVTTVVDLAFLLCMLMTICLGIPISEKVFIFLNLNGNITIRKLHTVFGYWGLVILGVHLGLHFQMMFAKLKKKVEDNKILKIVIYLIQTALVIYGIKAMWDTNLGAYLVGEASFAIPTSIVLSLINNFSIVISISIIVYYLEKLFLRRKSNAKGRI